MHIARQNLVWAAAYNFCGLPLAALGFVPPWAAAVGMSISSIAVILNALRVRTGQPRINNRKPDRAAQISVSAPSVEAARP
jgi:cation transport ATPase